MYRLMMSRICASSISISRGKLTEISLCLRFTELSSTVILKPSWEQSPRPYPVIDFIVGSMRKPAFSREQNRSLASTDRGCVEDQPQKATLSSCTVRNFLCRASFRSPLRLVFDTAAVQFVGNSV